MMLSSFQMISEAARQIC